MATKSNYQGGLFYDVLTGQGRDPLAEWKITPPNGVKRIFDKEMKGYILECGGGSNTKMQLPNDEKKSLSLVQPFLVLQILVPPGQPFSIELSIADTTKSKRRVHLSTAFKEPDSTPLHARIPLNYVKRGVWLNLCFDLVDIVNQNFKGQSFRTLDLIIIHPVCSIRRIFTMRNPPYDTTDDFEVFGCTLRPGVLEDVLPKTHELPPEMPFLSQIFTMDKLYASMGIHKTDVHANVGHVPSAVPAQPGNVHLAFGSRTPNRRTVPQHEEPSSVKVIQKTKSAVSVTPSRIKPPASKIGSPAPTRIPSNSTLPNALQPPTTKLAATQSRSKIPTPTTTTQVHTPQHNGNLNGLMTAHGMGSGGLVSVPASRQISSRSRYQEEGSDDEDSASPPTGPTKSSSPEIPQTSDDEYDDDGVRFYDSKVTGQPLEKEYNSSRYKADHRATSAMAKLSVQDSLDDELTASSSTNSMYTRPKTHIDNYAHKPDTSNKQQRTTTTSTTSITSTTSTRPTSSTARTTSATSSRTGTAGKSTRTSTTGLAKPGYDPSHYADVTRSSAARITNDDEPLTALSKIGSNKDVNNSLDVVVPKKTSVNKSGPSYGDRLLSSRSGLASPSSTSSKHSSRESTASGTGLRGSTSSSRTSSASSNTRSNSSRESTSASRSTLSRNQSNSSLGTTRAVVGDSTPMMSTSSLPDRSEDLSELSSTIGNMRKNSVSLHEDDEVKYDEDEDDSREYLHDDIRDESPRVDSDVPTGGDYIEEGVYDEVPPQINDDDDYDAHSDDEIVEQVHHGDDNYYAQNNHDNDDEYNDDEFEGEDDGDGIDDEGEYADTYYLSHGNKDGHDDQFEVFHSGQSFSSSHIDDESIPNDSDDEEF